MKFKVSDLGTKPGDSFPFELVTTAEAIDALADGFSFTGEIGVKGECANTGKGFRFTGEIHCTREFQCDRCLEDASEEQTHYFDEEFRQGNEPEKDIDRKHMVNYFAGDVIDLSPVVRDILLADQPLNNICSADCRGLCPKCGANLNQGDCGCDRTVVDPRWAALQQLFEKK